VPDLLLHDVIHASAERTPARVAVSYRDRVLTFAEVVGQTDRLAAALLARGVRHGGRVAWWGSTTPHVVALYFAVAQAGAAFVPLNPRYSPAEAAVVLDLAEPDLVVADETHKGDVTLDALMGSTPRAGPDSPRVGEHDVVAIFPTSGTTGTPKGVVLTHRAVRLRLMTYGANSGPTSTIFPPFHWGGWGAYQAALAGGTEAAMVDGGDTDGLLASLARRRVTRFYAIPAVWRRILRTDLTRYDLRALKEANTGTSATPADLLRDIGAALPGTTTSIGYGSTESGGISALGPADLERKPGSVGLPMPGLRLRFDEGVLWVSCPQLFSGYWRNPEATDAVLRDGWYCTGDIVERDDDGYLTVVGRARDMIRTGGETVAPAEVDVVLQRHPALADAAVAGVADDEWGEVVTAFVVPRPGASVDIEELRRHCRPTLAAFKHPRRVVVVDRIPRTGPTGQVQRSALAALAGRSAPAG
jgi:acyl-CoA synthetase (AMP-forming)/AMP-acid ligase II